MRRKPPRKCNCEGLARGRGVSELNKPANLDGARDQARRRLWVLLGSALGVIALVALLITLSNRQWSGEVQTEASHPITVDPCAAEATALDPTACPERVDYLAQLKELQVNAKPQLQQVGADQWAEARYVEISTLESTSLEEFDQGNYARALGDVSAANLIARELIEQAPVLLEQSYQDAAKYFTEGDKAGAQRSLAIATLIDPQDARIAQLAPRVERLDEVLDLLAEARVAVAENDLQKELVALTQIAQFDPLRSEHQSRITELQRLLAERSFSRAMQQAERALADEDTQTARRHVASANKAMPGRDVSSLMARISAVEAQRSFTQLVQRGDVFAGQDSWRSALGAYEASLAIFPTDREATQKVTDAQLILRGQAQMQRHLEQPLRLASSRVAGFVKEQIEEIASVRGKSLQLNELTNGVEGYLVAAQAPVSVNVKSDGLTHVEVRRVGIVGKHVSKTIQLTAGEFQFEGRRPGYRAEIVNLEIPFGAKHVEVTVACHERI